MEIVQTTQAATVQAKGSVLSATVNFNGALMEMLATVYSYILMAAIREAIQNGCDAARRKGLSFKEGVLVCLPTEDNPVITIIDNGAGMTREFIETSYMSFGTSTKTGDNGSAGGLGVGRWAAYGYIREAYITSTHEDEMVERTYFQFQGPNGMPQVQLASEAPGESCGTRVFFPVKDTDIREAYRAVSWLKEIMELTMGDSFSVDKPGLLVSMLPEASGHCIELGTVDASLQGIKLYPMKDDALQYSRTDLQTGSLVVLTNQAAGVGGLPFHVKSTNLDSLFHAGVVIEIPMSFKVAFMPSREEVKYTDEFNSLMHKIDRVGMQAVALKVKELHNECSLASKTQLSNLLGDTSYWHAIARAGRGSGVHAPAIHEALGGETWTGTIRIRPTPTHILYKHKLTVKVALPASYSARRGSRTSTGSEARTLTAVRFNEEYLKVNLDKSMLFLTMTAKNPLQLVYNDIASGGASRFRQWLQRQPLDAQVMYINADELELAKEVAQELSGQFGGDLEVLSTSSLPEAPRMVVAGCAVTATRGVNSFTYYCALNQKQETATMNFETYVPSEPVKIWLVKEGSELQGFKSHITLRDLTRFHQTNLQTLLQLSSSKRLYLLTEKQATQLAKAKASLVEAGLWDLASDEFDDDAAGQELKNTILALKSWMHFEDYLASELESTEIAEILAGTRIRKVQACHELKLCFQHLGGEPRMSLVGTAFDLAIRDHLDVMTGAYKLHDEIHDYSADSWVRKCNAIRTIHHNLNETEHDSDERKELFAKLRLLEKMGVLDYTEIWNNLVEKFPLLSAVRGFSFKANPTAIEHFCVALATLYR